MVFCLDKRPLHGRIYEDIPPGILIGLLLFSFNVQANTTPQGEILFQQVKKVVNKLKKALKNENIYQRANFNRLKRFIKGNNVDLALEILDDYELRGGQNVDKMAQRLRRKLQIFVPQEQDDDTVQQVPQPDCPGSGLTQTEFFSTERSFAALKPNGMIITWGPEAYGGDSSEITDEISCGVVDIVANQSAFAALKADGSVVTWGNSDAGGDSSSVSSNLNNVSKIYATRRAFAAVKQDGSLVLWGDRYYGGEAAIMRESYRARGEWTAFPLHTSLLDGSKFKVVKVVATKAAFAAILEDKQDSTQTSVITWGDELFGGDLAIHTVAGGGGGRIDDDFPGATGASHSSFMKEVSPLVQSGIADIVANEVAFAALKNDGSVVTWGVDISGGDSSHELSNLQGNVAKIFSSKEAFAAVKTDGSVVSWGMMGRDDVYSSISGDLQSGVTDVVSNNYAFVAVKGDGTMVSWGYSISTLGLFGGLSPGELSGVERVFSTVDSFAALKTGGSVIGWGWGIRYLEADALSSGVVSIVSNDDAFAARRSDGSVVTWGWSESGGDLPYSYYDKYYEAINNGEDPADAIRHIYRIQSGVVKIASTKAAFVALKDDGTIVTWGAAGYGADSSLVASLFGQ